MSRKIVLSYKLPAALFWMLTLFCYFFQVPYRQLASFITVFLLLFIMSESGNLYISRGKSYAKIFLVYVIFLGASSMISMIRGTDVQSILRFMVILLLLPITTWIKDKDFSFEEHSFIFLAICKSIYIIYLALQVAITHDYMTLRSWARTNGMGDIYPNFSLPFFYPKVQLQGNALILVAFFLVNSTINRRKWVKIIENIVLLIAIFTAGNFAFILGATLFVSYKLIRYLANGRNGLIRLFSIIAVITVAALMIYFSNQEIISKSGYSNAVRAQQAKMLLDANPIWGNGVGFRATSSEIGVRDYSVASDYYELQTLYIYNQIGFFGLILFMILTFMEIIPSGRRATTLYVLYLVYSFWNPYCFDTTHMIAIILFQNCALSELRAKPLNEILPAEYEM